MASLWLQRPLVVASVYRTAVHDVHVIETHRRHLLPNYVLNCVQCGGFKSSVIYINVQSIETIEEFRTLLHCLEVAPFRTSVSVF
jgi:hypothetical protein